MIDERKAPREAGTQRSKKYWAGLVGQTGLPYRTINGAEGRPAIPPRSMKPV